MMPGGFGLVQLARHRFSAWFSRPGMLVGFDGWPALPFRRVRG
jgi:hypothetical protein